MEKTKRNKLIIGITVSVICLAVICIPVCKSFFDTLKNGSPDIYIFTDISECEGIASLDYPNGNLQRHSTTDMDANLKGLPYENFFAADYTSDEVEFTIFAYTFADTETAGQYFENVTGKSYKNGDEKNYSTGTNASSHRICVYVGNRAYCITSKGKYATEIDNNVLPAIFSEPFFNQQEG